MLSSIKQLFFLFSIIYISCDYPSSFTRDNPNDINSIYYSELSGEFEKIAEVSTSNFVNDIAISEDGTLFAAITSGGLKAYTFNGTSFINTAQINSGGQATSIVVAAGNTVFLANGTDGTRVYSYNGASFQNIAHIDDGTSNDVVVAPDSTVYISNNNGLRIYRWDTDNLSYINSITSFEASKTAIDFDGTVFAATIQGELQSYKQNADFSLTTTAYWERTDARPEALAVGSDSKVFLASGSDGFYAFKYNGSSLRKIDHITNYFAYDVVVDSSETIYVANRSGVHAFRYQENNLVIKALIPQGEYAYGVAPGANGIIFLSHGYNGIAAYRYKETK